MNLPPTAYKSENIFNQLSEEEKLHLHSYNIAEIIRSIAEDHPETLELVLALAGPDVAEKIDNIYNRFVESNGDKAVELYSPALKTIGRVNLILKTEEGDFAANEASLDEYKNLIVKK